MSVFSLQLEVGDGPWETGGGVTGTVIFTAQREVDVSVRVTHGWRVIGHGSGGDSTTKRLASALLRGKHRIPFEVTLEGWPPTLQAEHFEVEHFLSVVARARGGGEQLVEERILQVVPGATSLSHLEREEAERAEQTVVVSPWHCCALLCLVVAGVAMWKVDGTPGRAMGAVGLFVAGVTFLTGFRNALSQRRLGEVFVGLESSVLGSSVPVLVHFKPKTDVVINEVVMVLSGQEVAKLWKGDDNFDLETHDHALGSTVSLSKGAALQAGERFRVEHCFTLAEGAPPSLSSFSHQINWSVEIRIDVKGWPDWEQSYPLCVVPKTHRVELQVKPRRKGSDSRCPYCHDSVGKRDDWVACAGCRTVFHADCIRELGVCSTRGCGSRTMRRRRRP